MNESMIQFWNTERAKLATTLENVVVALLLIVDLWDSVHLADRVQQEAITLSESAALLTTDAPKGQHLDAVHASIQTVHTLVRIAFRAGLMTKSNFRALDAKLQVARSLVARVKRADFESVYDQSMTDIGPVLNSWWHTSDDIADSTGYSQKPANPPLHDDTDNQSDTPLSPEEERAERVYAMIRDYGVMQMSDIEDKLDDVNRKTVQRALRKLLADNRIVKDGGGRWTYYKAMD